MIFLLPYAAVAVVMIGVQFHRLNGLWTFNDGTNTPSWFFASIATAVFWPITLAYILTRWLSSRHSVDKAEPIPHPHKCLRCGHGNLEVAKHCAHCGLMEPVAKPGIPNMRGYRVANSSMMLMAGGRSKVEVVYERCD